MKESKGWCKSTLLGRGWSEKAIKELLPEPIYYENPYFKCSPEMKVWDKKLVEKKEQTPEFKEFAEKKKKRSELRKKVLEAKKQEFVNIAKNLSLDVQKISLAELKERTLTYKKSDFLRNGILVDDEYLLEIDKKTLKAWELEYVLNNLTDYKENLKKITSFWVDDREAFNIYTKRLKDEIFRVYPDLYIEKEKNMKNG